VEHSFLNGFANRTVCTPSAAMWSARAVVRALGAGELPQKHWRFVVSFLILGLVRQRPTATWAIEHCFRWSIRVMELLGRPMPKRGLPISDDPNKGLDLHMGVAISSVRPAAVVSIHTHSPRTCGLRSSSSARGDRWLQEGALKDTIYSCHVPRIRLLV
jgi:hypothetical protein